MISLARPMRALARCSVRDEQPEPTARVLPYVNEREFIQKRLDELEKRTQYIEERLGIVRRGVEDSDRGVED